jgi:peptidoglycan L-alanyl-D-glutamate endopeptidase CwlK
MTLREEQSTFARDLVQLLIQATARGYEFTLGEVERTKEQQAMYLASGRSKTMNSMHLKRCAADIHWFKDGMLTYDVPELGKVWESLSPENSWGGNWPSFPDKPHFQRTV